MALHTISLHRKTEYELQVTIDTCPLRTRAYENGHILNKTIDCDENVCVSSYGRYYCLFIIVTCEYAISYENSRHVWNLVATRRLRNTDLEGAEGKGEDGRTLLCSCVTSVTSQWGRYRSLPLALLGWTPYTYVRSVCPCYVTSILYILLGFKVLCRVFWPCF